MSMKDKALQVKQDFDDVKEAGKQDAVTTWWNTYLQNGKRINFNQAFAGQGWYPEIFKPNHNLKVGDGYAMFTGNTNNTNLIAKLDELGITLDTSTSIAMGNFFYNNKFLTHAPELSFENIDPKQNNASVYSGCVRLQYIEGIYLKTDGSVKFTNWFQNCKNLTTIKKIVGSIGQDINLQWCDLDQDTVIRIFGCLCCFSKDSSEFMKHTIILSEKTWELTETPEWYTYFDSPGWALCEVYGWIEG